MAKKKICVGKNDIVVIQFSFSSRKQVPQFLLNRDPETPDESQERKENINGKCIFQPTERCQIDFVGDFSKLGFCLVEAFHQERINAKNGKGKYQMVRFLFIKKEKADIDPDDLPHLKVAEECLVEMLESTWRVRAYQNPDMLSVNLEARYPIFDSDGSPKLVWPKDEKGEKIKTGKKIKLQPDHFVQLE